MKTILMVFALALSVTLTGSASTISSVGRNLTGIAMVSKTNASSNVKSEKSKKKNHKHHKSTSGSKKTK